MQLANSFCRPYQQYYICFRIQIHVNLCCINSTAVGTYVTACSVFRLSCTCVDSCHNVIDFSIQILSVLASIICICNHWFQYRLKIFYHYIKVCYYRIFNRYYFVFRSNSVIFNLSMSNNALHRAYQKRFSMYRVFI